MIRNNLALLVATGATAGFASLATAQDSSEPDCPEDANTEAGCQIEDAQESERQPVEGAETASVAPDEAAGEGSTTMTGPDSDGSSGSSGGGTSGSGSGSGS